MQSALERRQQILEIVSDCRVVKMQELARKFDVSIRTIQSDIQILACSHPIYTENWRGGGVRAMDGWYLSRRYLHDDQEALLRSLLPGLQPNEQKTMEAILTAFAKPNRKETKK